MQKPLLCQRFSVNASKPVKNITKSAIKSDNKKQNLLHSSLLDEFAPRNHMVRVGDAVIDRPDISDILSTTGLLAQKVVYWHQEAVELMVLFSAILQLSIISKDIPLLLS